MSSAVDSQTRLDYTPSRTCAEFMRSSDRFRVLLGPVGCVAPETRVWTEYGLMRICDITAPTRVLSWDERSRRFVLSPTTGGFLKGEDYLYRISVGRGVLRAAGHHRLLSSDGTYLPVSGGGLSSVRICSRVPLLIFGGLYLGWSRVGGRRYTRRVLDYLCHCGELARQYGLRPLGYLAGGQFFRPLVFDGNTRGGLFVSGGKGFSQRCGPVRSRQGRPISRLSIGRFVRRFALGKAACRILRLLGGRSYARNSPFRQSPRRTEFRHRGGVFLARLWGLLPFHHLSSCSDRTILGVEKENVKSEFWDIQVLDTHNYVTEDGTIHHNSGKSVSCAFEVIRRASMQEPNAQGIRKSRCAVVRQTARQLLDTTIKTFLDWFPEGTYGTYLRTIKTYHFKLGDVECEVMFRALDDANDVANLSSLELTFAWLNECRDISAEIVEAMTKRVGRYPSMKDGGPTWHGIWCDTNPPTMETWWYYQMEGIDPSDGITPFDNGWDVYKQPSGRSPEAENVENLPEGYYDTRGRSEEYIRMYIDGQYGLTSAGDPVYKYFRPNYHMARESLKPLLNGHTPVLVGMDLGLCPAAVIGQLDPRGRTLILDEAVSYDMGIQRFIRLMLKPLLLQRFTGAPIMVVTDPAGVQRAQTDERNAIDIIKAEGLKVMPARTNNVTARIAAVDDFLMRHADGEAAFLMDPRCRRLKSAMMGGYRFHIKTGKIEKDKKHSHIAEALQYLMLHITSREGALVGKPRPVVHVNASGWT